MIFELGANFTLKCALQLSVGFAPVRGGLVPFLEAEKLFDARFSGSCGSAIPNPYARTKFFFVLCNVFPNFNFGCTKKFYKFFGNAIFNLIDALGL